MSDYTRRSDSVIEIEAGSTAARMDAIESRIRKIEAERGRLSGFDQTQEVQAQQAALRQQMRDARLELGALEDIAYAALFKAVAKELLPPETYMALHRECAHRQVRVEAPRPTRDVGSAIGVRATVPPPRERQ